MLNTFSSHAGVPCIQFPYSEALSGKVLFVNEASMEKMCQVTQSGEAAECDWESLISDAADLLNFDSPKDAITYRKSLTPAAGFYTSITNCVQTVQQFGCIEQGEGNDIENPSTQPLDGGCLTEFAESRDMNASSSQDNDCLEGTHSQKMDSEVRNVIQYLLPRFLIQKCFAFNQVFI